MRDLLPPLLLSLAISIVAGEPLTLQEAHTYLRLLVSPDEETAIETPQPAPSFDFNFLPSVIISACANESTI